MNNNYYTSYMGEQAITHFKSLFKTIKIFSVLILIINFFFKSYNNHLKLDVVRYEDFDFHTIALYLFYTMTYLLNEPKKLLRYTYRLLKL